MSRQCSRPLSKISEKEAGAFVKPEFRGRAPQAASCPPSVARRFLTQLSARVNLTIGTELRVQQAVRITGFQPLLPQARAQTEH